MPMLKKTGNIGLVIVLFNPNAANIDNIRRISPSYKGVLVDNSATRNFETDKVGLMTYLPLFDNTGIAHAQNAGAKKLLEDPDIKYLVFFDQDSDFDIDLPARLSGRHAEIARKLEETKTGKLAVLGPSIKLKLSGQTNTNPINTKDVMFGSFKPCNVLISSGCCISVDSWKDVGGYDDGLFIDEVDFEWCWRAKSKGYMLGEATDIIMEHNLGGNYKIFPYKHAIVGLWSPVRYYYIYRNHILMMRRKYLPKEWKRLRWKQKIFDTVTTLWVADNRFTILRFMIKGCWHGIMGKTGRIDRAKRA